jgi:hypothetical protein
MASVRDLVEAGLDEGLVKQAIDVAGFERKRGRGGLSLDVKGIAKVLKTYNALLAKLTAKAAKFNSDKLSYNDEEAPAPKAKAEKKAPPKAKKAKAAPVEDEDEPEDEPEADDDDEDDEVEEADDEEDDE